MTVRRKPTKPLHERVQDAGGWYLFLNKRLIELAGPPQISPRDAPSTYRSQFEKRDGSGISSAVDDQR